MGPDIKFSLQKFIDLNPEFKQIGFPTGAKVSIGKSQKNGL